MNKKTDAKSAVKTKGHLLMVFLKLQETIEYLQKTCDYLARAEPWNDKPARKKSK